MFKIVFGKIPKRIFYIIYIVIILSCIVRYAYDVFVNNVNSDLSNLVWKLIIPLVIISIALFVILFLYQYFKLINEFILSKDYETKKNTENPKLLLEDITNKRYEMTSFIERKWKKKVKPNTEEFIDSLSFSELRCACKYNFTYVTEPGILGSIYYYFCSNPECKINTERISEFNLKEARRSLVNNYKGRVRNQFEKYFELYKSKI